MVKSVSPSHSASQMFLCDPEKKQTRVWLFEEVLQKNVFTVAADKMEEVFITRVLAHCNQMCCHCSWQRTMASGSLRPAQNPAST